LICQVQSVATSSIFGVHVGTWMRQGPSCTLRLYIEAIVYTTILMQTAQRREPHAEPFQSRAWRNAGCAWIWGPPAR